MTVTTICLAATPSEAEDIVHRLHQENVSEIAVFVHPQFQDDRRSFAGLARPASGPPSAIRGAVQGGTAGGVASAATMLVPFIGPFLFAVSAPLAVAAGVILGAAVATAAGPESACTSSLTDALGLSDMEAPRFERALEAGHYLIAVRAHTEAEAHRVEHLLISFNAEAVTQLDQAP